MKEKYGYLGFYYDCNRNGLKKFFDEEDLDEFGIEEDAHVTVLYGFTDGVKKEDIKKVMSDKYISKKDVKISGISLFENSPYDVLKLDIDSKKLHKYNKFFSDNFPYESDYGEYVPHLTIAKLRKGKGKKYSEGEIGQEIIKYIEEQIKDCDIFYKYMDSRKNPTRFSIIHD